MSSDGSRRIIFGAGGGVARTSAREGAAVFLAGRTQGPMETVAAQAGGVAGITTFGTSLFPAFGLPPTL